MINVVPFTAEEEHAAEKRLRQLVKALARRLESANRKVASDIRPDVNINAEIFDTACRLASPLSIFCQSEADLLELIHHVVTDYDPYVGDFILKIKPDSFSRYCLRAGINLPQKSEGTSPVKMIFWAALLGLDVNSPDVLGDFRTLVETPNSGFIDFEK